MVFDGEKRIRKEFKGKIWLEIFLLPGYNMNNEELTKLKELILKINPDSVQLNTLDRPGTVSNLTPADFKSLKQVVDSWELKNVEIISSAKREESKGYRKDTEAAILETISRRPCTIDDLMKITGYHIDEINKYLDILESKGKIETIEQNRGTFYQLKKRRTE